MLSHRVHRYLTLLIIGVLMLVHGSAIGAAVCRHGNANAHVAARQSHDPTIALAALQEDDADAVTSKKAAGSNVISIVWLADLLPFRAPISPVEFQPKVRLDSVQVQTLVGMSVSPLLRPPAA